MKAKLGQNEKKQKNNAKYMSTITKNVIYKDASK